MSLQQRNFSKPRGHVILAKLKKVKLSVEKFKRIERIIENI